MVPPPQPSEVLESLENMRVHVLHYRHQTFYACGHEYLILAPSMTGPNPLLSNPGLLNRAHAVPFKSLNNGITAPFPLSNTAQNMTGFLIPPSPPSDIIEE
ncbi:hypothetical protein CDAR_35551 [Caerostris darwini]|uniref:Uncharacterized protein n=1 Tax=Caerostris darwini TaxID=1538125 RepID=A0AAV4SNG5_9ARAC|nr:hypothetical protein CDAR_35551 [Caerostris darwini]